MTKKTPYEDRFNQRETAALIRAVARAFVDAYGSEAPTVAVRSVIASAFAHVQTRVLPEHRRYPAVVDDVLQLRALYWGATQRPRVLDEIRRELDMRPNVDAEERVPFIVYLQVQPQFVTANDNPAATDGDDADESDASNTGDADTTGTDEPVPADETPAIEVTSGLLALLQQIAKSTERIAIAQENTARVIAELTARDADREHPQALPVSEVTAIVCDTQPSTECDSPTTPIVMNGNTYALPADRYFLNVVVCGNWDMVKSILRREYPSVHFVALGSVGKSDISRMREPVIALIFPVASRQDVNTCRQVLPANNRIDVTGLTDARTVINRHLEQHATRTNAYRLAP